MADTCNYFSSKCSVGFLIREGKSWKHDPLTPYFKMVRKGQPHWGGKREMHLGAATLADYNVFSSDAVFGN